MTTGPAATLELCHEIHTSERRSYRSCRRRWNWITRDRWYPKMTAKPLEFGVAYHKAMEVYYEPTTWFAYDRDTREQLAIAEFVKVCEAQRKKFLEVKDETYLDDDVNLDYDERVELGKGMLQYYIKNISPDVDRGFKPIKVEIGFKVPVRDPAGRAIMCRCDQCWEKVQAVVDQNDMNNDAYVEREFWRGLPVVYAGRLDALMEDENGDYWIYDWKTARSVSQNDEFLYLDDQVGSYVWALRMMLGLPVRGFIYHEQKKGYPKPPEGNKVQRLGRWFSVAKNQDTDYDVYLKTVKEEDTEAYEAGLYDDFLDWLKTEGTVFFKRFQIHKNEEELKSIGFNIWQEATEMTNPDIPIYPNPGRFGCSFCAFRSPCMGVNGNEDYMYTLETLFERRQHYYIREEASTESKAAE